MTMTMSDPMIAAPVRPRGPEPRARLHSFSQMPTETITLSPAFIEALQAIAPRSRRRVLPGLLALLALAVVVWAAAPATARQGVLAKARGLWHRTPTDAAVAGAPAEWGAVVAPPALERAAVAPGVATLQVGPSPSDAAVAAIRAAAVPKTTRQGKKAPKKTAARR